MTVKGNQGSFPHLESGAPAVLWMLRHHNAVSEDVRNPYFSPFLYHGPTGRNKKLLQGGGGASSPDFGHVYHASIQHGSGGLGGVFASLFNFLKPVAFRAGRALVDEGLRFGSNVLSDYRDSRLDTSTNASESVPFSLRNAVKKHGEEAGIRLKRQVPGILLGKGGMKKKARENSTLKKQSGSGKRQGGGRKTSNAIIGAGKKKRNSSSANVGKRRLPFRVIPTCPAKVMRGSGKRKSTKKKRAPRFAAVLSSAGAFNSTGKKRGTVRKLHFPTDIYSN